MFVRRGIQVLLLAGVCASGTMAQDLTTPAPLPAAAAADPSAPLDPSLAWRPEQVDLARPFVSLAVPKGTALVVAIDHDVRVEHVGQPIHARLLEPIYAFDKLVIPVGAAVTGRVTEIDNPSAAKRTAAALDADFSPERHVEVEFDHIVLSGDQGIPMRTFVTPGSGQPIEFVAAAGDKGGSHDAVTEKVKQAKEEAKQEWNEALKQADQPGKMRRAGRYGESQLPVHPQYIQAGTVYFAELDHPLDFGSEPLTQGVASSIGAPPPNGSVIEARLVTPLSSATSHPGDPVEAVLTRPLFDGNRLVLPQGSRIEGTVLQSQPAHHPGRNGQLRIVFRELSLPDGVQEKIAASLEGVESEKRDNVKLDSEGGARATAPPTRYLTTAMAVGLGGASFLGDSFGETGPRTAGAAGGYKLIGIALGLAIHSQPLGMAMGAFGASRSIYGNFIARGHDVNFPKNTAMAIALWQPHDNVSVPKSQPSQE